MAMTARLISASLKRLLPIQRDLEACFIWLKARSLSLSMTWPPEVIELLLKMMNSDLRTHDRDSITMDNLEHFDILANNLQWAASRHYRRLIYHIHDSINANSCVNRSFSPNFIDQEMRCLASWFICTRGLKQPLV